jgi:tRNA/tmRNA/rRNA uracil-C5-methylase (TrmA/RlmC/RlmD family)
MKSDKRKTGAPALERAEREPGGGLREFILPEAAGRGLKIPRTGTAVLAGLDYGLEIELKNSALRRFWQQHSLPGRPEAVVPSPRPRHYRTTSKRRWRPQASPGWKAKGRAGFFAEGDEAGLLEPKEHKLIFQAMGEWLVLPEFAPLARVLNFVIIRGTYTEFMVIFNLQAMNRGLNRLLLKMASSLRGLGVNVISAFLFLDPSRSPYYLETDRPRGAFSIKRLFGPERFRLHLGDLTFSVPPLSFSQVNQSVLPLLLDRVHALLGGRDRERLVDLYCGYGLFTYSLRDRYREIVAIDAAAASIRAAHDMLEANPGRARIRFKAMAISRDNLAPALGPPPQPGAEDIILDPPRRGTDAAAIRAIARRRPGRILHLFCASEEILGALGLWQRCGYFTRRVVPVDMFAGTPQLETLVLLSSS